MYNMMYLASRFNTIMQEIHEEDIDDIGFDPLPEPQSIWEYQDRVKLILRKFNKECYWLNIFGRSPELNQKDWYFQLLRLLTPKKFYLKNCKQLKGWYSQLRNSYQNIKTLKNDYKQLMKNDKRMMKKLNLIKKPLNINHFQNQLLILQQNYEIKHNLQPENNDFREFEEIGLNEQVFHQEDQQGEIQFDEEELYLESLKELEENLKELRQWRVRVGLDKLYLDDRSKEYYFEFGSRDQMGSYQETDKDIQKVPLKQAIEMENPMAEQSADNFENRKELHLQSELEQYLTKFFENQIPEYELKLPSWNKFLINYTANVFLLTGHKIDIQKQEDNTQTNQTKETNLRQASFVSESENDDSRDPSNEPAQDSPVPSHQEQNL